MPTNNQTHLLAFSLLQGLSMTGLFRLPLHLILRIDLLYRLPVAKLELQ